MPAPGWSLLTALCLLVLCIIGFHTERMFDTFSKARLGIVLSLFVSLAGLVWLATRRQAVSVFSALVVLLGLGAVSKIKFDYTGASLHAFDLYYYLRAPTELVFFAWHQPKVAAGGLTVLALLMAVAVALWRAEHAAVRARALVLPLALLPMAPASHYAASDNIQTQMLHAHFYDGYHLTSWFISGFNPIDNTKLAAYFPGKVPAEKTASAPLAAQMKASAPLAAPVEPAKKPNIILVLHKSTIDPRPYVPAERQRFTEDPFVSGDGATRKLIVETFGGRTWISEYGVMFGLSTHYFRPNQTFLGYLLPGKVRHSLAHALGDLGYGSTYVYPAPRSFANTGPFYKTLGFERVLDYFDQTPPAYNKRDRDHYDYAIRDLKARREAKDARPQFTFVMTEATHFPWDKTYFPDVRADEARPGDPWSEYARRLRIGHDDYQAFKARLAREFPDEQFLVIGFGDHHPILTGPIIADTNPATSPRFDTFYRVDGVNFTPDYVAAPPAIEIGYLGNVMLSAAGLPLDESFVLRARAMADCRGLMYRCADQSRIIAMHRRLVERGDFVPKYSMGH